MNENFCVFPWIHLHTMPDGKAVACCMWQQRGITDGVTKDVSIQDIADGPMMSDVRSKMLSNQEIPRCHQCNVKRSSGDGTHSMSLRDTFNNMYKDIIPDLIEDTNPDGTLKSGFKMRYLNIRFSNLCNFSCRSCAPEYSSLWAQEIGWEDPVVRISDRVPGYLDQVIAHLPTVDGINFAGGESMLVPEHWEILDRLIELGRTNIPITFTTNLSKLVHNGRDLVEYARRFPMMRLHASLDAMGPRAEIYRNGTVWERTEENLRRLMESSIPFNVQCTVGATNIYHVPDLQKHLIESSLMKPDRFTMNMLVAPENLSTRVLPIGYKSLVCDRISKHRAWLTERGYLGYPVKQWEEAAAFMMLRDRSSLFGSFLDYHRMLDARRKQDTFAAFPELKMAEAMHAPPSSR